MAPFKTQSEAIPQPSLVEGDLPPADNEKYSILRAHRRTDGSYKSIEELEIEYIELTDKLIHTMTHGELDYKTGERMIPTKVIFLDKSARPLAWLTRDLWDTLAPDPDSDEVPKRPDFKFLNIDRNQWRPVMDPNGSGLYDATRIPEDQIEGLRSLFNKDHDGSFEAPNELDDETIMIVDEVRSTGATLEIAQSIVARAFPGSRVFGTHWMSGVAQKGSARGNADLPVWYRDDSTNAKYTTGRGVGNRREGAQVTDPSQHFMSTRLPQMDQRSLRLREDFKTLRDSMLNGETPYIPSSGRMDDEERAEHINKRSLREVKMARQAIRRADSTK